jgi:hypothetical protein
MGIKFKIEEARWHGCQYYHIKPKWNVYAEDMLNWCIECFGPPGDAWSNNVERWYANSGGFFFRKEYDLTIFLLRWS